MSFIQDARRFQRDETCDMGNTDEFRCSCYSDRWKNASTYRCKSRDLFHATGRHRGNHTSAREITIMFTYLPSTGVERPAMQTPRQRKDFAQMLLAVKWISTTVCGWCARAHVPVRSCGFTNGYFQGQEIGRILQYHIPKGEATGGAMLASRLSVCGTKGTRAGVTNPVLQKFSACTEEHGAKGNSARVQPITHNATYDSTREASTSGGVHQEKYFARLLLSDPPFRVTKSTFEKCLCQRLTCARLHRGICSIRIHEQYQFFFQIFLGTLRFPRGSATPDSVKNRNNLSESSRTLQSQQADIGA